MKNEYDENIINLKAQNRNKMNSSKIKQVVEEYEEIMKLIQTT
jgi:hypothetical protein